MHTLRLSRCLVALGLLAVSLCGGCAAIPLSAIGSVASLGNSSVSSGRDSYFFGKLTTAEMCSYAAARAAVKSAAADLSLRPRWPEQDKNGTSESAFLDEKDEQVGVRIERLTNSLVRIRVDIGLLGPETDGRLFLMRVRAHLPRATTEPSINQS
jgi:hypothetical protein